jgi:hypothetical protein
VSTEKLEAAIKQYPEITFRTVDRKVYHRFARRFRERINADPRFAGWEDSKDNLKKNPDKYGTT